MENKNLKCYALIALFLCSTLGILTTMGIQTAYAADDGAVQYSMVIYYNDTSLDRAPQTHQLTIYENGMEKNDQDLPIKRSHLPKPTVGIKTEDDNSIDPVIKQTIYADSNPAITPYSDNVGGLQIVSASDTPCNYISTWVNGTMKHIVPTEDFAQNFNIPSSVYPTIQKSVVFNSPQNYVSDYLGHTEFVVLDYLINQTIDFAAISTWGNTYVGDKYGLFNVSEWDPIEEEYKTPVTPLKPTNTRTVGTQSTIDTKVVGIDDALIILAIAIIVFVWFGMPEITKWVTESEMAQTTRAAIEADKEVALAAITAEYNITMSLIAGKAIFEANVLAMIANGTLTYDQGYAMLGLVGGQYTNMINVRATNLRDMANDFYNATGTLMDKYIEGAVAVATWSNWTSGFVTIGIVIIAVLVAYYLLIKRKSGGSGVTIQMPSTK